MRCTVDIYVLYIFSCSYLMESIISIVDRLARETKCDPGVSLCKHLEKLKGYSSKEFSSDAEE